MPTASDFPSGAVVSYKFRGVRWVKMAFINIIITVWNIWGKIANSQHTFTYARTHTHTQSATESKFANTVNYDYILPPKMPSSMNHIKPTRFFFFLLMGAGGAFWVPNARASGCKTPYLYTFLFL